MQIQNAPKSGRSEIGKSGKWGKRLIVAAFAVAGLFGAALTLGLQGNQSAEAADKIKQGEAVPDIASLHTNEALKDIVDGKPDAPVTIVEYSSLTCGHCATFHAKILPELKKKYIDTGKVRYIRRGYPLNNLDVAGFVLARCKPDQYKTLTEDLWAHQEQWLVGDNPLVKMRERVKKSAGFTDDSFVACLGDQKLIDNIVKMHDKASQEFDVNSTPTVFVNGQILRGPSRIEQLEALMGDVASDK
jgi:protein-disulfide isomerase